MGLILLIVFVGMVSAALRPLNALTLLVPDRMFVPLSRGDLELLHEDEDVQDLYVDCLALIQDLLCRFVGDHGRPRFSDVDDVAHALDDTLASGDRLAKDAPKTLSITENMHENVSRARTLAAGSAGDPEYAPDQVARDIGLFLDATLQQFQLAALPMP